MSRRGHLLPAIALLALAALIAVRGVVQAQAQFPVKPIRFVVPAAGNTADVATRMIGPRLRDDRRQPVVVENRAGAGGTLAAPPGIRYGEIAHREDLNFIEIALPVRLDVFVVDSVR